MTSNKTERTQKLLKETVLLIDHGDELSLVSLQGKARSRRSTGKKQVIHKCYWRMLQLIWYLRINNMQYQRSLGPMFDALHSGVAENGERCTCIKSTHSAYSVLNDLTQTWA
ncbi:hypothetical protein Bca101_038200 [Brassica carinata]